MGTNINTNNWERSTAELVLLKPPPPQVGNTMNDVERQGVDGLVLLHAEDLAHPLPLFEEGDNVLASRG